MFALIDWTSAYRVLLDLGYTVKVIDALEREGYHYFHRPTAPGYTHVATAPNDHSWRLVTCGNHWYFAYTD